LSIKNRLSNSDSKSDRHLRFMVKYETQSVLENSKHELCYDMSILIDLTIHSNKTDKVTFDKPIKESYVADAAIFNP
jgi:hypothetical protein